MESFKKVTKKMTGYMGYTCDMLLENFRIFLLLFPENKKYI